MKKKLGKVNNKGMTIIELILCFAIVSVIVIALLNTVMNYKTKEQLEDTKKTIISYKNVITKVIQSDIIYNDLAGVKVLESTGKASSDTTETWSVELTFNKPFLDGSTVKLLQVVRGNTKNYIIYPDIAKNGDTYVSQNVRYNLETSTSVFDVDVNGSGSTKVKYSDIRFAYVSLKATDTMFRLDIPIYHSELGTKYHINIVAPINYLKNAGA